MSNEPLPSRTPVLIVGGGPVGLTASVLLSQHGISNVVVERRQEPRNAPAAHVLRPRSMEVFEHIGVAEAIERVKPALALDYITWCASVGGVEAGKLDLRLDLPVGTEPWTNCPQNLLEPILYERAGREAIANVVTGAECVALEQDAHGVRATIERGDGAREQLEARWMIAADGAGSPVRHLLEIPMVGPGPQGHFFMVHFDADLRPFLKDREGPIFWILNPAAPGSLIVHDPARSHVMMFFRLGTEGEEESIPARLEAALGSDTPARILSVDSWSPHVQVAERYRDGRIFLAGDAAHRFPPTGGLGLNTGILDVDFLVHQLALVEKSGAPTEILDSYESTCRPVAVENATESFENMKRLGAINEVLGPCSDLEALEARLTSLDRNERQRLNDAIEEQRSHFLSNGRLPPNPRSPQGATL